ncbi:MAG: hypothetical protein R2712_20625 [Vicinamibacterales bacterium]
MVARPEDEVGIGRQEQQARDLPGKVLAVGIECHDTVEPARHQHGERRTEGGALAAVHRQAVHLGAGSAGHGGRLVAGPVVHHEQVGQDRPGGRDHRRERAGGVVRRNHGCDAHGCSELRRRGSLVIAMAGAAEITGPSTGPERARCRMVD